MIAITRTVEPAHLPEMRTHQLATVTSTKPDRTEARRTGYTSVKDDLVAMQHGKCAFCERIETPSYNDVEHYRPFARYWWLAWTWDNLLFACARCNRSHKRDHFPLRDDATALTYPQQPPGAEEPLLLDPCTDDPRRHIRFEKIAGRWMPLGLDERGRETIALLGLASNTNRDLFARHAATIQHTIDLLRQVHARVAPREFDEIWRSALAELLGPTKQYRALTEDILRHEFPSYPAPPP